MKRRVTAVRAMWIGVLGLVLTAPVHGDGAENVAAAIGREDHAASAERLRTEVERSPDDEGLRFELARVSAWAGNYDSAIAEYDVLIAASPENVDYSLGRAQALAWADRDEAALDELARARSLAPDYEAVWELEFSILRRGGAETRARLDALRPRAARRFPAAGWWVADAGAGTPEPVTEWLASGVHQSLSTGAPDWGTTSVRVTRSTTSAKSYYGSVVREQRFGETDTLVGAGGSFRPAARWSTGVDVELGAQSDFMPETTIAGWTALVLPSSRWEPVFRVRHRRYDAATVTSIAATAGRYFFGNFRAAYTLDLARLRGQETSTAHVAALNYYHSARLQIDLTLAQGDEAEVVAPGTVLQTNVEAVSFGARHSLGDRWRLSWWLGTHRQGELYRRDYVGLALAARL